MYGIAKHVIVTAIFNSNKAKVMIRKIEKDTKTKRIKIIYTRGVKHTARGPNPARCVVGSGPRDDFVK